MLLHAGARELLILQIASGVTYLQVDIVCWRLGRRTDPAGPERYACLTAFLPELLAVEQVRRGGSGVDHEMTDLMQYDWSGAHHDVALLVAIREARERAIDRLAGWATDLQAFERLISVQRDLVFLIAEFFYALKAMDISSSDKVIAFIENHNQHIDRLCNTEFRGKVGGRADRLRQSKFGPAAIRMIQLSLKDRGRLVLSQSDIARFLVEVMSDESCRRVISGLCEAGLLVREEERANKAILVWSERGVLEAAFGRHLAELRLIVASFS